MNTAITIDGKAVNLLDFPPWKLVKGYNALRTQRAIMEACGYPQTRQHPLWGTVNDTLGLKPWTYAIMEWGERGVVGYCTEHDVYYVVGTSLLTLRGGG